MISDHVLENLALLVRKGVDFRLQEFTLDLSEKEAVIRKQCVGRQWHLGDRLVLGPFLEIGCFEGIFEVAEQRISGQPCAVLIDEAR